MAKVAITEQYLTDIADAIRTKTGQSTATYYPSQMAPAILTISGSGGITPTGTININTNGTHNVTTYASANVSVPASAVDTGTKSISISSNGTTTHDVVGYASVSVTANVPNSYSTSDEGKVVSSGALVSQTSDTVTANDTYDTTLINSLTVNVSGGGGDQAEIDDVTFIDYDGTILYSYSKSDFLALSAMPANPSHTGLTAQGWNWTLAQAQTFVTSNDSLCIGQNYRTVDGKTHVIADIDEFSVGLELRIRMYTSVKSGVTVDWGDGSTSVPTGNADAATYVNHTYQSTGTYEITITATSGTYRLGYSGSNSSIFHYNSAATRATAYAIKEFYVGSDCTQLHRSCTGWCRNLEKISLPTTLVKLGDSGAGATGAFCDSLKLKGIVVPSTCEMQTLSIAESLPGLKYISIGSGSITSNTTASRVTYTSPNIEMLTLPNVSSFANNGDVLYNVWSIKRFVAAGSYTTLYGGFFRACGFLKELVIPASVTTISDYAMNSSSIKELHMKPTTPPTVANTRGLPNNYGTIYVPYSADHSILNAYQTATNWTGLASIMQEEPQ